jgi:hypothetical protein
MNEQDTSLHLVMMSNALTSAQERILELYEELRKVQELLMKAHEVASQMIDKRISMLEPK